MLALITGASSGMGRDMARILSKRGYDLILVARRRERLLELKKELDTNVTVIAMDLSVAQNNYKLYEKVRNKDIDILINNCGVQFPQNSILDISSSQLKDTFETNVFTFFYLSKAVLPFLKENSSIINTTSITAFDGKKNLIDYSATKGAITVFTKSLALSLANKKIRVNAVAPGPIWTPLIPSSFSPEEIEIFGSDVPLKRAGQPFELAPAYLYLASDDSRYVTGQIIHVNGGTII